MTDLYITGPVEADLSKLIELGALVKITPDIYIESNGGLSGAFYKCELDDADGAVIDIRILYDD